MNIMTQILCVFAIIGLIDKFLGDKWGLGAELDKGMKPFMDLVISASGFYVFGLTLVHNNTEFFARLAERLPFDVSVIIGSILSSDLGAAPISDSIAATPTLGYFGGTMIGSGLGMSICYLLPIFFTLIPQKEYNYISQGFLFGLLTLPVGLIVSGLLLGLTPGSLGINMIPVLILCLILAAAFKLNSEKTLQVLSVFGEFIRKLCVFMFMIIVAAMFFPAITFVDKELVYELLYIVLRIAITCGGGMVAAHFILKYMNPAIESISKKLGINMYSVIGLFLNMISAVAMLGVYQKMDKRGKIANIAFSICGSHVIGGQMAYIAGLEPSNVLTIYAINKIIAGVLAVILTLFMCKEETVDKDEDASKDENTGKVETKEKTKLRQGRCEV